MINIFLSVPSHNLLYSATLSSLPGAYLLVAAGLALATVPVNLVMRRLATTFRGEQTRL